MLAAVSEAATGSGLLILPTLVSRLLLGVEQTGVALVIARVTGIALISLAIACWPGRTNSFCGMLTYNALMTAYFLGGGPARMGRTLVMAGSGPARTHDDPFGRGLVQEFKDGRAEQPLK